MEDSISKEKVFREVRNALINRVQNPFSSTDLNKPVFHELKDDMEVVFAEKITASDATFIYCGSQEEFIETVYLVSTQNNWKNVVCHENRVREILDATRIESSKETELYPGEFMYITSCEALVARSGSIILSSAQPVSRKALALAHTHVVFALASQMHEDLKTAINVLEKKYEGNLPSFITSVSGKSILNTPALKNIPAPTGVNNLVVFFIETE